MPRSKFGWKPSKENLRRLDKFQNSIFDMIRKLTTVSNNLKMCLKICQNRMEIH